MPSSSGSWPLVDHLVIRLRSRLRRPPRRLPPTMIVCGVATVCAIAASGCNKGPQAQLQQLVEARRLAADLLVQFTGGADAANRAVMADTDETSVAFAREADQAAQAVQRDADALGPILRGLQYSDETRLLDEFGSRFAAYRTLDRSILALAVENTNLKAQRLSFGPGREAADAFRDSLQVLTPRGAGAETARAEALAARAVAAVRDMQVLQAPHIAESDETAMTLLEKQMATAEAAARTALRELGGVIPAASRSRLSDATAALDKFVDLNSQMTALSRRNTNVRSLALTLGQKRGLTAACEESLRALQDALVKRGFSATR